MTRAQGWNALLVWAGACELALVLGLPPAWRIAEAVGVLALAHRWDLLAEIGWRWPDREGWRWSVRLGSAAAVAGLVVWWMLPEAWRIALSFPSGAWEQWLKAV
ncbi:MAG: hypothetical protein D6771_09170, partial [Zetaproteobacteria bacterium]